MKIKLKYFFIFSLLVAAACNKDNVPVDSINPDYQQVTLSLSIPYTSPTMGLVRHGLEAEQENFIETLDVLIFEVSGGIDRFLSHTQGQFVTASDNKNEQIFTAILPPTKGARRLVLISNASSEIDALLSEEDWTGADKEDMLQNLLFDITDEKWDVGDDYQIFPMWGEIHENEIASKKVQMLRMTARIDVVIDGDAKDHFVMTSVHVFNTNTSGRIAPKTRPSEEGAYIDLNTMTALRASLPESPNSVFDPIQYTDFSTPGETGVAMKGAIYLMETEAKNTGNLIDETFVVVGGIYGGGQASFYRIDFFRKDGRTLRHLDILRNHTYTCVITSIIGDGYETVEEAANGTSFANIVADVFEWNDGDMNEFKFNNLYILGVNKTEFTLSGGGAVIDNDDGNNILKVFTDFPGGFNLFISGSNSDKNAALPDNWLTEAYEDDPGQTQTLRLIATPNTATTKRTAWVHVEAAGLSIVIEVTQGERLGSIEIVFVTSSSTNHEATNPPSKEPIEIKVIPYDANGDVDDDAEWTLDFNGLVGDWIGLTQNYSIQPEGQNEINWAEEQTVYLIIDENHGSTRNVVLRARLKDGEERYIAQDEKIFTQLSNPDESITVTHERSYLLNGNIGDRKCEIFVLSNKDWKVSSVTQWRKDINNNVYNDGLLTSAGLTALMSETGNFLMHTDTRGKPITLGITQDRTSWGRLTIEFEREDDPSIKEIVTLIFAMPRIKILGITSAPSIYGYNVASTTTNRNANAMLTGSRNFGLNTDPAAHSTVYSEGFDFILQNVTPTNARLQQLLFTEKPDIVVTGFYYNISAIQAGYFLQYMQQGGVLVLFDENETSINRVMAEVFPGGVTRNSNEISGSAGSLYRIGTTSIAQDTPSGYIDDPITNGVFGDLRGLYWGEDASETVEVFLNPASLEQVIAYTNTYCWSTGRYLETISNTNQHGITSFRHKTLPFFYLGDAGFLSAAPPGDIVARDSRIICPFFIHADTKVPLPKNPTLANPLGYGRQANRYPVYNSQLFGNIMTWAISETTLNHKY